MSSNPELPLHDPDLIELKVKVIPVRQPIGDIYIASMSSKEIISVAYFDVRRRISEERDFESYLGIQRPLNMKRVNELEDYVNFVDATFPSSIIVAIERDYVDFDSENNILTLKNFKSGEEKPSKVMRDLARVLDGQHRIAGLERFRGEQFEVPVSIFVGADIADQAYIFSTVNLEQTKVHKSLAYDLFALSRSRSPQKTAHNIAIALDRDEKSPFFERIKRLGVATPGRDFETLTQSTVVEAILGYISNNPKLDRDLCLRGKQIPTVYGKERDKYIFRNLFANGDDIQITRIIYNYYNAVDQRWPKAWQARGRGLMLNRSNGFRALFRFLRPMYLYIAGHGGEFSEYDALEILKKIDLQDGDFNTDNFVPGTSGESALYHTLLSKSGLERDLQL